MFGCPPITESLQDPGLSGNDDAFIVAGVRGAGV